MELFFMHKRGLRQGDPLSPLLFNLAADVFQQMITSVNNSLAHGITPKIKDSILAFQYADDTAVISSADITSLTSLKLVIRLFAAISGLRVNYNKSLFIPLNVHSNNLPWVRAVIGCPRSEFPVQYLGMPLSISRPPRHCFMPLIEKIENKLGGWKTKLLSRGGRLQLVKSVLSSIPIYYMMCFRLPQWVIGRIDSVRRNFLWGSSEGTSRGISLINWPAVCMPRQVGGLGVLNLNFMNISLLLRWWWKLYDEPDCLWSLILEQIRRKGTGLHRPKLWLKAGSFFWTQLQGIRFLFAWSTYWQIGTGQTISYWFDAWDGLPRATQDSISIQEPLISLNEAWPRRSLLDPTNSTNSPVLFSTDRDQIKWKWNTQGCYSSKSAYKTLIHGGKISWQFSYIWKTKATPSAKIFAFLALNNRVLTREVLRSRGMMVQQHCVCCNNCPFESLVHLIFLCPFATEVWFHISIAFKRPILKIAGTFNQVWIDSCDLARRQGHMSKMEWATLFICAMWNIWKNRNNIIFRDEKLEAKILARRIIQELRLWIDNG